MKKKACKSCKMLVDGSECPACKKNKFATGFQGQITVLDPAKSEIAKIMGYEAKGEYAIKINK